MKKYFSKIVIFSLTAALSFASILCCDFSKLGNVKVGQSHVVKAKAKNSMPACHAKQKDANAPVRSDCNCCAKRLQADQPVKISIDAPQAQLVLVLADDLSKYSLYANLKFKSAYLNGPPGTVIDDPLFISLHNIRI